jgi:ribosome-binding protein aMBF1 (putative translation factor)
VVLAVRGACRELVLDYVALTGASQCITSRGTSGASRYTDKSEGVTTKTPIDTDRVCGNSITPLRHDERMVRIQQAAEARHLQADRRRIIEQRRQWGLRITWIARPEAGWLAEVRQASGLSTRDLAERLGVDNSTVTRTEASERKDTIHLGVLKRYAEAMDAELHYVILPKASNHGPEPLRTHHVNSP